jgi:hypothetical protein
MQATSFLRESLASDPSLPFWREYIDLSARRGMPEEALALLREVAGRDNLKRAERDVIEDFLARALLAADHVDEGVSVLRERIKAGAGDDASSAPQSLRSREKGDEVVKNSLLL